MIAKSYISQTLNSLDRQYRAPNLSQRQAHFISKMALIELCGWVEESIDDLLLRASVRILAPTDRNYLEQKIKETYGFHYEKHFRPLLLILLGEVSACRIESKIPANVFQNLKSSLGHLKPHRDKVAHTHIRGTKTLDAPSALILHFNNIAEGLEYIDDLLRRIKIITKFKRR